MKTCIFHLSLMLLAASMAFYVFYIDAPERWITPGVVELSDDEIRIVLTNRTDRAIIVNQLGFAWQIAPLKHHMILFEDRKREIFPKGTFIETHSTADLGSHRKAILAAKNHKLILNFSSEGKRRNGLRKFSRLPVLLHRQQSCQTTL